jgi:hypothetical protein
LRLPIELSTSERNVANSSKRRRRWAKARWLGAWYVYPTRSRTCSNASVNAVAARWRMLRKAWSKHKMTVSVGNNACQAPYVAFHP